MRSRTAAVAALALGLASLPACLPTARTGTGKPRRAGATSAGGSTAASASPRSVLDAYLRATLAHQHDRAWTYLTHADQVRLSRASYRREQAQLDEMRRQVEALGKTRSKVGAPAIAGDRATAQVTLTSGLGSDHLRFVLRREQGHWRVDYAASWAPVD